MSQNSLNLFRGVIIFALMSVLLTGCAGPAQKVSKADEERYRHPPPGPPPEYKGNQLGMPSSPPSMAPKPGQ